MKMFKTIDEFMENQGEHKKALIRLREIILSTGLIETIKWGSPVYTLNGKNIAGIGAFKSYFGIWFFQGALLQDLQKNLVNAQEGKTKALRQWRFKSIQELMNH